MKRHIDQGIPVPSIRPGTGLKTFSAAHLEARAIHAARLHSNWHSDNPKPTRAIEFQLDKVWGEPVPPAVTQVLWLPGRSGEFLLTLAEGVITAWEVPLDGSGAYCVAKWVDMLASQIIVNQDPDHEFEIAYWAGDTEQ